MKRIILAITAIAMLVTGGTAAAAYVPAPAGYTVIVTRTVACGSVTVTATGFGLAIDTAFQLVAGKASTIATIQRLGNAEPFVTATFTTAAVGPNGTAIVRTRYGGYIRAGAQVGTDTPYSPAELIGYATC